MNYLSQRMKVPFLLIMIVPVLVLVGCFAKSGKSTDHSQYDSYTITSSKNFLTDYAAINPDGSINAVVEIPAGTTAKWEVSKMGNELEWEFEEGKPRVINYLAYPSNYGMIPQTLSPKELGGDGDPLDVIILGETIPRGEIVKVKAIAVLKLLDNGEQDDKLVAVQPDSRLGKVENLPELMNQFPGITTIIETWFINYKGKKRVESNGYADVNEAHQILRNAMGGFQQFGGKH